MLTAITEITRNGSRAARGLTTIQSRYNQILDNTASNGKKLIAFYEKYNIQLYDEEGQLRSLWETLSDLAEIWDTLSENEQKYFLNVQAGANQSVNLGALMKNFSTAITATETALNSAGSAMRENERYMESIEARTQLVKADFQSLAVDVIDSQLVKSVLSLTSAFLKLADTGIGQVVVKMSLLGGLVGSGGALVHATHVVPILKDAVANLRDVVSGTAAISSSTITLGLAGVAALTVGIIELVKYIQKVNDPLYQLNEGLDRMAETQSEIDKQETIANLAKRYKELRGQEQLTKTEETELDSIRQQLAQHTKGLVGANDEYNDSLDTTVDKVADIAENEKVILYGDLLNQVTEGAEAYQKVAAEVADRDKQIAQAEADALTVRERWLDSSTDASVAVDELRTKVQEYHKQAMDGTLTAEEEATALEQLAHEYYLLTGNTAVLTGQTESAIGNFIMLQEAVDNIDPSDIRYDKIFGDISTALTNLKNEVPEGLDAMRDYEEKVFLLMREGYITVLTASKILGQSVGDTQTEYRKWFDTLNEGTLDGHNDDLNDTISELEVLQQRLSDINTEIDNVQTALSVLAEAQDEYNEYGAISVDTLQKLLELDAEYLDALFDENGQLNYNAKTISDLIDGKNVLLDRLAAEAIATYAVEEAERQFNKELGDTQTIGEDTAPALEDLALKAIESGESALFGAGAWTAFHAAIENIASEKGLQDIETYMANVTQYAEQVMALVSGVSTGLTGWRPSTTPRGGKRDTTKTTISVHDNLISLLESEYNLLVAQSAATETRANKIKQIQAELHSEAERLRDIVANAEQYNLTQDEIIDLQIKINGLSSKWWDWQDKLNTTVAETAEEYAKLQEEMKQMRLNVLQTQEAELNNQVDAFTALQAAMESYYDTQIANIDTQIAALQNANDELDKQIELQEHLDALARAKEQKVLVYQNGSWQYVSDPDKVAAAAKSLEEYERKRRLEEQIVALEAEKSALEALRSAWSNMTQAYERQQDEWLISQELGINTALSGWQRLVQGAEYWAGRYMNIMGALSRNTTAQALLNVTEPTNYPTQTGLPYESNVDYSAKMLGASTLDEVAHWASLRNAKIAGEGLTPARSTESFIEQWKREHGLASGTLSAVGGLSLVGEHGAELRVLNSGDGIIPAEFTKNLMRWGSITPNQYMSQSVGGFGSNMNVTIQALNLPNVSDGAGFVDYIRNNLFGQVLSFVH